LTREESDAALGESSKSWRFDLEVVGAGEDLGEREASFIPTPRHAGVMRFGILELYDSIGNRGSSGIVDQAGKVGGGCLTKADFEAGR
jgi:hypothetical protein